MKISPSLLTKNTGAPPSHYGFMNTRLWVTHSSHPWMMLEPEPHHKPINRESLFHLESEALRLCIKTSDPYRVRAPLLQRIHLSLGAVCLQSVLWRRTKLCHKRCFGGFFARVCLSFITARDKRKFWRSHIQRMKLLLLCTQVPLWRWLPQSFPQTKPQHNNQRKTSRVWFLPTFSLSTLLHVGKHTEGAAPVCVAAPVVHNVPSHGTACRALTKLAVTALPGVPPVGQDGEGVCNKKCNEFYHHREPFNCFATKLKTGTEGKISWSVYFKEIFLEFKG